MQPLPQDHFFALVRKARRDAGLSQSALAEKAGCRQSQISAFEAGVPGKITRETALRIAETLGIEPPPEPRAEQEAEAGASGAGASMAGLARFGSGAAMPPESFCPNFECLSNLPYFIGEQLLFLPLPSCGEGARCAVCGELLERRCPSCGAPFRGRGGCCEACGRALIELPEGVTDDPTQWAAAQRAAVSDFASMAALRRAGAATPWPQGLLRR